MTETIAGIPFETQVRLAVQAATDAIGGREVPRWQREAGAGWEPETPPGMPTVMYRRDPDDARSDEELRCIARRQLVDVLDVETRNAGRLATLLWASVTLRIAQSQGDETAGALADDIARWTLRRYPRLATVMRHPDRPDLADHGTRQRIARWVATDETALPRRWRRVAS